MHDDELTADERLALASVVAPAPPAGFVDRVDRAIDRAIDRADARGAIAPPAPRGRARLVVAVLAAAGVASGAIAIVATRGGAQPRGGSIVADVRHSVALGDRAVAVTEPGTSLAWAVQADGSMRTEQPGGNAFYRVDHGGPFVVATPLGDVRVTGTCFRVEVFMKPSRQSLFGGAIGAAIAAAVVVTVYEGGVVVAGHHGGDAKVAAGERATITPEGAPIVGPAGTAPIPADPPPIAGTTREQLLARDEAQRQKIATLSARVGDLERLITENGGKLGEPVDGRPWYDPSPERLAAFAKNCEVRIDVPPILGSTPFTIDEDAAKAVGLTAGQRASVDDLLAQLQHSFADRMRLVYIEVVGEGADPSLSAQAMIQEIQDKSPPGEAAALRARIAQERAGLAQPPADWSHARPIERMLRMMGALGDETEKLVGGKVGNDLAHAMRVKEGGWGNQWSMAGCDDKR